MDATGAEGAAPQHTRWIVLPELLLLLLGALSIIGLLAYAADREDRTAGGNALRVARSVVQAELDAVAKTARDYGWWSEAVENLVVRRDPRWVATHLGNPMAERFGISDVLVVDPGGKPELVFSDGSSGGADLFDHFGADLESLVGRAREGLTPAVLAGEAPPKPVAGMSVPRGGGVMSGHLHLAAASPLVSAKADGMVPDGSVLVFVRHLDGAALERIGRSFGFADLALAPADEPLRTAGLTLTGLNGESIGRLVWTPAQPGRQMMERVTAPVIGVLATMALLAYVVVRRAVRSAEALDQAARLLGSANRELETSRRRFRDFAESASDWFWESGADHGFSYVSERLAVLVGAEPRAVFGASLFDLQPLVEDADTWEEVKADILAQRPFRDLEVNWQDGDRTFVFRLSGQPVTDGTGRFLGYRGTGVDVTVETMALVEARFMQVVVHDALDSISEGFVLFSADGRLLVCNDRYRQAYPNLADLLVPGVTFEEILRTAAERGGYEDARRDMGSWIRDRLKRHLAHQMPVDQRLSDGRWYRISEHATGSGGVVKILMDITELKLREQELADQTGRLKATLESISQGICMFDHAGGLAAWNDDFARLLDLPEGFVRFGRSIEEFTAQLAGSLPALADMFVPETEADTLDPSDPLPPPVRWQGEPLRRGDRFLEVRRTIIPEGGFVATFADVTEHHRYNTVLRDLAQTVSRGAGEEFFRNLVLALARALSLEFAFVGESGGDGRVRMLARAIDGEPAETQSYRIEGKPCERVFGRSAGLFPKRLPEQFPEDDVFVPQGAVSYCGVPLYDSVGQPIGVIAVLSRRPLEDVASIHSLLEVFGARAAAELERIRTATAMRESERRYRQLVELAPYGIAIWDRAAIRFANSSAASILGTTRGEGLEGRALAPFLDGGAELEARLATAADGKGQRVECEILRPSGERRHVEIGAYPAVYQRGPAVLLVINDVTDRRRAEEELQRSQKMEAVGRMAGGIAHEFNNMLTAIGGFARLAERSPEDAPRVLTCVREIAKASDRAAALTAQLLDFSRRKVGEETEVVALAELVRDLRVFLKPLMSGGIDLAVEAAQPAYAVASPVTLNQALLNLAINARDAMPEGGRLSVALETVEPDASFFERHEGLKPGRYAVLRVADDGCGVPEEIQDRIWEPFFTTKEPGKGTGLGLWMVYGTAQQAGGTVEMESEPGKGSRFSIFLPAVEAPDESDGRGEPVRLPEGETASVLLVDDEESVRSFLRLTLEEAGCRVVVAGDGVEALERYDSGGGLFDLVVTDVAMPRMNGVELARALDERNPGLRILFLTGFASRDQAEGLKARPGSQLLMKPLTPERLLQAVRELLEE